MKDKEKKYHYITIDYDDSDETNQHRQWLEDREITPYAMWLDTQYKCYRFESLEEATLFKLCFGGEYSNDILYPRRPDEC